MAPAPWWRTPPGCCWIRRASSRASRCPTLRPFRAGCRALWKEACRSEEHTSELQSLMRISYAVFCLKKKKKQSESQITQLQKNYNKQQYVQQQKHNIPI